MDSPVQMDSISTNEHTVKKICEAIDVTKASAVSNISTEILKHSFLALILQLTFLINKSFRDEEFPAKWKMATITPMQKSGDPSDVNNLRPISLLPLPGKIAERVAHTHIYNFLENNKLLNEGQGGFRKGHSTVNTVAEFTDDILLASNTNNFTISTFVDLTKAFDTVNHTILLNKVKYLGLHPKSIAWLKDYLANRKQCTRVNGQSSDYQEIKCGVPQGSILGPLLFLIYINDINKVSSGCQCKMYADHTVFYFSHSNCRTAYNQVQCDLNHLGTWCEENQLTINIRKTKSMIFCSKNMMRNITLPKLKINSKDTEFVKAFKYLGVKLDNQLNYGPFLKETASLIAHKIYIMSKVRKCINTRQALIIYKSKVLPYFDYGDIFYIGAHQQSLGKLQKLQNRGLRICLNAEPRMSVMHLHNKSGINLLEHRRYSHLLILAYKRQLNPKYTRIPPRQTRLFEASVLDSITAKNRALDRSVYNKCAMAWNSLSTEKRNIPTLERFKANQKRYLLSLWAAYV